MVIGLFATGSKKYCTTEFFGDSETVSLLGNMSTMDGAPSLYPHIVNIDASTMSSMGTLQALP
jgi:predicted DNA-binding protein with PD1-like motif